MAAVSKKSILSAQYGAGNDVAKDIAADTSLPSAGIQDPPPGIKNGKAQLDEVKFDVFKTGQNEGKPYYSATAIIVEPLTHTYTPTSKGQAIGDPITVRVAGMQTRVMIPIVDQKVQSGPNMGQVKSWQDQLKAAAQQMRALGADTSKVRSNADLEGLAERLTAVARRPDSPIYLSFNTSVRKAQNDGDADGAWQNWNGTAGLENYSPPDGSAGVNDASEDAGMGAAMGDDIPAGDEAPAADDITTVDVDILIANATNDDQDAQNELMRRASEVSGKSEDELNSELSDWSELKAIIEGTESAEEAPAEPEPPKKGDHFGYKPMVKGIGGKLKPAAKAIECSCETVNAAKKTVTLKNTVDGKTLYKDVPWDALEEVK